MILRGPISGYNYFEFDYSLKNKIYRAEVYAASKYNEHKNRNTDLYHQAEFEVWHNHCYDNLSIEKFDDLVFKEFIFTYTTKMIWKDIHDNYKK